MANLGSMSKVDSIGGSAAIKNVQNQVFNQRKQSLREERKRAWIQEALNKAK